MHDESIMNWPHVQYASIPFCRSEKIRRNANNEFKETEENAEKFVFNENKKFILPSPSRVKKLPFTKSGEKIWKLGYIK